MRNLSNKPMQALALAAFVLVVVPAGSQDRSQPDVMLKLAAPLGIATDPQGSPFLATADGRIIELAARKVGVPLANTEGKSVGLAFDAAGDLYVADPGRKAVLKIRPWGETAVFADHVDGAPFTAPARLAISENGDVYLTDTEASRVYRIDAHGKA